MGQWGTWYFHKDTHRRAPGALRGPLMGLALVHHDKACFKRCISSDKRNNHDLSWGLKPSKHWWDRQKRKNNKRKRQKEMTATLVPNTAREIVFFPPLLCFWFTSSPQFNCWWLKHNRKIFDNRNLLMWDKPELAGSWQEPWVHIWNSTWTRTHIQTHKYLPKAFCTKEYLI